MLKSKLIIALSVKWIWLTRIYTVRVWPSESVTGKKKKKYLFYVPRFIQMSVLKHPWFPRRRKFYGIVYCAINMHMDMNNWHGCLTLGDVIWTLRMMELTLTTFSTRRQKFNNTPFVIVIHALKCTNVNIDFCNR